MMLTGAKVLAQPQDPAAQEYLKRGNANLRRGDLAGAVANYDKSIEINPRSAEAHFKRGQARRAQGNLDEAIDDYEIAVEIDPELVIKRDVADAYYNRGFIKANELEMDNAIRDFNSAIKFNPKDANAFIKRGESHLMLNELAEAIADFDQVISLGVEGSSLPLAYIDRGYAKMLLGDPAGAREDFTRGLKLDPERRFFLELHLRMLEALAFELKRRRESVSIPVARTVLNYGRSTS